MRLSCLALRPSGTELPVGGGGRNVTGRRSGGVSEHVKTHTRKHAPDPTAATREPG